jgi:hypothetical protein
MEFGDTSREPARGGNVVSGGLDPYSAAEEVRRDQMRQLRVGSAQQHAGCAQIR